MTELFAVVEYVYYEDENGGGELCGIFSTSDKAVAYVKKLWEKDKYPPENCVPDEVGNYVITNGYSEHYFSIEKVILDEER